MSALTTHMIGNQREKEKKRNFNKRLKAKERQRIRSLEEGKSRSP
jgi:hypothetical protein